MTASDLDARYGRTPARRTRARLIAIAAAIGVTVVVTAWLVWAGAFSPTASIESKDVGYLATSDDSGLVRWQLTTPADTAVSCSVKALSEKHAVVGWRVIDVPPSSETTRILRATLRTSEPTVSGGVHKCWLTANTSETGASTGDLS
jgi:hypothetical protein